MAKKGGRRVGAKKSRTTQAKPVAKAPPRPKKTAAGTKSVAAPKGHPGATMPPRVSAVGPAQPTLLERAERLRDVIEQSKLSPADPWAYTSKARPWSRRAQQLVDEIARSGETPALRRDLEALGAQVEGDRDFQEARRRA